MSNARKMTIMTLVLGQYGNYKLQEGLWYYDLDYDHDPNYEKKIDALLRKCGKLRDK
jgi:hypothetical protein